MPGPLDVENVQTFKIYFTLDHMEKKTYYEPYIKQIGAQICSFFGKEITHLIIDDEDNSALEATNVPMGSLCSDMLLSPQSTSTDHTNLEPYVDQQGSNKMQSTTDTKLGRTHISNYSTRIINQRRKALFPNSKLINSQSPHKKNSGSDITMEIKQIKYRSKQILGLIEKARELGAQIWSEDQLKSLLQKMTAIPLSPPLTNRSAPRSDSTNPITRYIYKTPTSMDESYITSRIGGDRFKPNISTNCLQHITMSSRGISMTRGSTSTIQKMPYSPINKSPKKIFIKFTGGFALLRDLEGKYRSEYKDYTLVDPRTSKLPFIPTWRLNAPKESSPFLPKSVVIGPLNNEVDPYKAPVKKIIRGYCECCKCKFNDMDTHLAFPLHKQFASNPNNYQMIDDFIARWNLTMAKNTSKSEPKHHIPKKNTKDNKRLLSIPNDEHEDSCRKKSMGSHYLNIHDSVKCNSLPTTSISDDYLVINDILHSYPEMISAKECDQVSVSGLGKGLLLIHKELYPILDNNIQIDKACNTINYRRKTYISQSKDLLKPMSIPVKMNTNTIAMTNVYTNNNANTNGSLEMNEELESTSTEPSTQLGVDQFPYKSIGDSFSIDMFEKQNTDNSSMATPKSMCTDYNDYIITFKPSSETDGSFGKNDSKKSNEILGAIFPIKPDKLTEKIVIHSPSDRSSSLSKEEEKYLDDYIDSLQPQIETVKRQTTGFLNMIHSIFKEYIKPPLSKSRNYKFLMIDSTTSVSNDNEKGMAIGNKIIVNLKPYYSWKIPIKIVRHQDSEVILGLMNNGRIPNLTKRYTKVIEKKVIQDYLKAYRSDIILS